MPCGNSASLLQLIGALNDILGTSLAPDFQPARTGDVRDSCADITRAGAELSYKPNTSFEEGLGRTVKWYRSLAKPNAL